MLGKKLEVISRDDGANPGDAVRVADELVTREGVELSTGTFLSHIGLAVTEFAGKKKVFFLAAEPLTDKITWQNGNRYTFRLRASTYMQVAMLMPDARRRQEEALGAGLSELRVRPVGRRQLQGADEARRSRTSSSSPSRRRRSARSRPARSCRRSTTPSPTASSTCCSDPISPSWCARAPRAARSRTAPWSACSRASRNISIRSRTKLRSAGSSPAIPGSEINTPEHKAFVAAYQKRWNDYPRLGSVVGYDTMKSLAAGIAKAGLDRHRETGRCVPRAESVRRTVRRPSTTAPATTRRPSAPMSARSPSRTARAPWRLQICRWCQRAAVRRRGEEAAPGCRLMRYGLRISCPLPLRERAEDSCDALCRVSDCLVSQAFCQGVLSRIMALRIVRSFRMTAVMASFLAFPAETRRW